mmetsp:Transcript_34236/g.55768  ORF Transcript_34236/g.55768 Transcript_34236/m.55768 type:complete len:213 (-) Transcript_34236:95-733(-)
MRALFFWFLAIAILVAKADYETCVSDTSILTGVSVSIARDEANQMVQITLMGPADKWFGHGFDGLVMADNYVFVVDDRGVSERRFPPNATGTEAPSELDTTSIVSAFVTVDNNNRTAVIVRPYSAADAFDFTPFLTCPVSYIETIAAYGIGPTQETFPASGHAPPGTNHLYSTCVCSEAPTTMPTEAPTAGCLTMHTFISFYVVLILCWFMQ